QLRLARNREPPDVRARRRPDHRPDPDRGAPRTRSPRTPPDRRPGRSRPFQPRWWHVPWPVAPRSGAFYTWQQFTATRYTPAIVGFYHRLRPTGHPGKVALTAAMRKLLTILNAILRDHRPW